MTLFNLSFRSIHPKKDLKFLASVYASTRIHEFELIDWSEEQVKSFLKMQFELQHKYYQETWPDAEYLIILLDGKKVGRLYKDYRDDEIRVIDISFLIKHRQKGYGRKIIQDILDEAQNLGKCVRIHVEKNNPAKSLYDRLGFIKIGGTDVYNLMEWKNIKSLSKKPDTAR